MKAKVKNKDIQDLVLDRAAGLISKRGAKGWSMADLARECGLAKNTLYKIIESKEKLFETIVLAQIDVTTDLLKTIIRQKGNYRSVSLLMLKEGPALLAARPRVTFPEIFLEYPALKQKALEHRRQAASELIDFIKNGQKGGQIRADMEPEFLYDLVRGIVDHYTRSGLEGAALSEALSKAFTCLREGVRLGNW
jgi:AcrR family transcriptional regulator